MNPAISARPFVVRPISSLSGEILLPGDKSIAHRCLIIGSISRGNTLIKNLPLNKDCLSTVEAFKKLGIKIRQISGRGSRGDAVTIKIIGRGLSGLKKPKAPVFVGESGTTFRLLLGILAGQDFETKLSAGESLSRRPMLRVTRPLRMMGAEINAQTRKRANVPGEEYPPITIRGGNPKPIIYKIPVASAQVKSAILLAALYAQGKTTVKEPAPTRDHTERLLRLFRADIKVNPSILLRVDGERSRTIKQNTIVIKGRKELTSPGRITVPGDISSAAFFLVAAAIMPDSEILIKGVSLNPLRTGVIRVLKRMGADIGVRSSKLEARSFEPVGDLIVKSSRLKGTMVKAEEIPSLIDELPVLMVAASLAKGRTVFKGVGELRVKETDRIRSMSENLNKMGASVQVKRVGKVEDIIIEGVKQLKGARVRSFGDHRTAMSMVVAGLKAKRKTFIDDVSCISKSLPNFFTLLKTLI